MIYEARLALLLLWLPCDVLPHAVFEAHIAEADVIPLDESQTTGWRRGVSTVSF